MEARAMSWLGATLPWQQAYQQANQWQQSFDWRQQMDEFRTQMERGRFGLEEGRFGLEEEQARWGMGFQEEQLAQQKALEEARQQVERENAALAAFGRRFKPQTRWM
jgi:hypothetical protein